MPRRIVIIQGHPDPSHPHFGHAVADAYAKEAAAAGHEVRRVEVANLNFPMLRGWDTPLPDTLSEAQAAIRWSHHLVLVFPLWLGTMPASLKGFLEQVLRPGFAFDAPSGNGALSTKGLKGKSARIIVTMGMPAFWYRCYFLAHGVKVLERSILKFCGVSPVRETYIGMIEASDQRRRQALARIRKLGAAAC
jgi:putative NADPH-quinone reductase